MLCNGDLAVIGLYKGSINFNNKLQKEEYSSRSSDGKYSSRSSDGKYSSRSSDDKYSSRSSYSKYSSRSSDGKYSSRSSDDKYSSNKIDSLFSSTVNTWIAIFSPSGKLKSLFGPSYKSSRKHKKSNEFVMGRGIVSDERDNLYITGTVLGRFTWKDINLTTAKKMIFVIKLTNHDKCDDYYPKWILSADTKLPCEISSYPNINIGPPIYFDKQRYKDTKEFSSSKVHSSGSITFFSSEHTQFYDKKGIQIKCFDGSGTTDLFIVSFSSDGYWLLKSSAAICGVISNPGNNISISEDNTTVIGGSHQQLSSLDESRSNSFIARV